MQARQIGLFLLRIILACSAIMALLLLVKFSPVTAMTTSYETRYVPSKHSDIPAHTVEVIWPFTGYDTRFGSEQNSLYARSTTVATYGDIVTFYVNELTKSGWSLQCDSSEPEPKSLRFMKHFQQDGEIEFGGPMYGLYSGPSANWITAKKGEDYAITLTLNPKGYGVWTSELRLVHQ